MGFGTESNVDIFGRANQFAPIFDANGDLQEGLNFVTSFTEGMTSGIPIISPRAFFRDSDIGPMIEEVNVTLTNPQLADNVEFLAVTQVPPAGLTVTVSPHNIQIRGSFSPSDTEYVTALLSIEYRNLAEEPGSAPRAISITVSDGRNLNSPQTMVTINLITFNDVPVVDLNGAQPGLDNTVSYTEGSSLTLLAPNLTITDPDSPQLVSAAVNISVVFDAGNESISLNTTVLAQVGSITCVPASCSGESLQLSGSATHSDYETVLRTLQYINLKQPGDFPALFDRSVYVTVSDGEHQSSRHILVDVNPINPRIILELDTPNVNYFINFTEDSAAELPVVGTTRLVDISLQALERIIVTIRNPQLEVGEKLIVNCTESGLSTEINNAVKQITFSQKAIVQKYQRALECLRYVNNENEPIPVDRFVDFLIVPGGGAPNNTVHTTVHIIHHNDNPPQCNLGPTGNSVPLSESSQPGDIIHTLQATDIDLGNQDGLVTYQLLTGNESGRFGLSVEDQQLRITLLVAVDFEGVKSYPLVIQSCDQGIPILCCNFSFSFNVTDANDNPPVFRQSSYTTSVDENVEKQLLTFVITDEDSGTNGQIASLEIESVSPLMGCMDRFNTTTSPLALYTANGGLDFELRDTCNITLLATDGGNPPSTGRAVVTVNVIDVDDLPPVLTGPPGLQFGVQEDNAVNIALGTVTATDLDSNDNNLVFSLPDTPTSMFLIIGNTGSFVIGFSTNFNVASEYTVLVRVEDPSGNFVTGNLTVRVIPVNNEPPVLDLNSSTPQPDNSNTPVVFMEESGTPVTLETSPVITDPDPVNLTITMVVAEIANGEDAARERLLINNATAPLHMVLSSVNSFELQLQVSDPHNLMEVYSLIESIQYMNTEDELSPCRADRHPCGRGPNSRTILIRVFDGMFFSVEREAYVTFQAINDAPEIDLDTTTDSRVLRFVESGPPAPLANLPGSFFIRDDDNAYLQELTCNLTNPQDVGESLLVTSTLSSSLTLTGNDTNLIRVSGNGTLEQYTAALGLFNYFSTSTNPTISPDRVVECFATDGDLVSDSAIATIQFQELNNLPRLFLGLTSVEYEEEGPPVLLTSNPSIFDEDDTSLTSLSAAVVGTSVSQHVFSLNTSLTAAAGLNVSLTPLRLTVTGSALISTYTEILASISYQNTLSEFPSVAPFQVIFIATDSSGNTSVPVSVTVNLLPRDDNSPQFVPSNVYNFNISEAASSGTIVGELHVTDEDRPTPQSPMFRFIEANPGFGVSDFLVRSKLGSPLVAEVVVDGLLDYDNRATGYTLVIEAMSGESGTVFNITAMVNIIVLNENDLPPVFVNPPDSFSVFENDSVGAPLMPAQLRAEDPDGFPLQFSVTTGSQYVAIGSNGHLSLAGPVDREGNPGREFDLTVSVSDGVDTAELNFTVFVLDVNEHPPQFERDPYQAASITENALPPLTALVTVQATDRDEEVDLQESSALMTRVTYSLHPGLFSDHFFIDDNTGDLFQNDTVDFESTSSPINLTVVANDNGSPPLTSTTTVVVPVVNINDERPVFVPDVEEIFTVLENSMINLVISGSDPDPDRLLRFSLTSSLPSAPFMINSITGRVTQTAPTLDVDAPGSIKEYSFTVTLTDNNTDSDYLSRRSTQANFTVVVEDVNDNVPLFERQSYTTRVNENAIVSSSNGTPLITVHANDSDYGLFPNGSSNGNNEIRYTLEGAPDGVFSIGVDSGVISVLVPLDRENQSVYTFRAVASDSPVSGQHNQAYVTVTINVDDQNEHAPVADPDSYTITTTEAAAVGTILHTYVSVQWSTEGM